VSRPALGPTQAPSQWVSGVLMPNVKRPVHEANHSSAEVKNAWGIPPQAQYVFMAWCLIKHINVSMKSRDSSVGIATGYGLDDRSSRVRFRAGAGSFSLHHRVHNCSGAHPASYPMGIGGSFPVGKAAGA
jgi:hypothetical protein